MNDNIKRVLQLDGGGARGMLQVSILREIERMTGKPIHDIFDMIIGTSVGSIIGGSLSTKKITATDLFEKIKTAIPKVFKTNFFRSLTWTKNPKYNKEPLIEIINSIIGKEYKFIDCPVDFICTATCVNDGLNYYFKSWKYEDKNKSFMDIVNRSYAAPYYFEPINDDGKTWVDGGTGNSNCSLDEAIIESINRWYGNNKIYILSVGCGHHEDVVPYDKTKDIKTIGAISFFMDPVNGGLARRQSAASKVKLASVLSDKMSCIDIQRIEPVIIADADIMDGVKYIDYYINVGTEIAKTIDYNLMGVDTK